VELSSAYRSATAGVRALGSASVIVLATVGGLGGAAILFGDRRSWPATNARFTHNGSFLLWAFVIVVQAAIWPTAVAWIWPDLQRLRIHWRGNQREILESLGLLAAATWAGVLGGSLAEKFPSYLPHHTAKLLVLSGFGWLAGSVAATGIWLVHGALKEMLARSPQEGDLEELLDLRETLQRFLFVSGSIIGLAILGAGAERNMIAAFVGDSTKPTGFPIEFVLIYGCFFSAILALVYFPTQLTLTRTCRVVRDHYAPLPNPSDATWAAIWQKRTLLDDALSMKVGASGSFKAGVTILTPLLGSVTGLLLNVKS
jgi:hypothetical protein